MKYQPNRNYKSNDDVQTPPELCERIVNHFKPRGRILEPAAGDGNFVEAISKFNSDVSICEIKKGIDFLSFPLVRVEYDWIITNPPWSKIREFLCKSMSGAKNIVFLMTINHLWTKARIRDIKENNFGIKEIFLVDMPKSFPQSGFQLGAIHLKYKYNGSIKIN